MRDTIENIRLVATSCLSYAFGWLMPTKGLDANAVMALCGNRNGSFGNGWDGIIALIVIAAIRNERYDGLFVRAIGKPHKEKLNV